MALACHTCDLPFLNGQFLHPTWELLVIPCTKRKNDHGPSGVTMTDTSRRRWRKSVATWWQVKLLRLEGVFEPTSVVSTDLLVESEPRSYRDGKLTCVTCASISGAIWSHKITAFCSIFRHCIKQICHLFPFQSWVDGKIRWLERSVGSPHFCRLKDCKRISVLFSGCFYYLFMCIFLVSGSASFCGFRNTLRRVMFETKKQLSTKSSFRWLYSQNCEPPFAQINHEPFVVQEPTCRTGWICLKLPIPFEKHQSSWSPSLEDGRTVDRWGYRD